MFVVIVVTLLWRILILFEFFLVADSEDKTILILYEFFLVADNEDKTIWNGVSIN